MSKAYRARHSAPKSHSRGTVVVAATGLLTTPTVAVGVPVFSAVSALAMVGTANAATSVAVTNRQATLVSPPTGSVISPADGVKVRWTFDVPAGASADDTTTFTVPNYLSGSLNGLEVRDPANNLIGTISGSGQTFTLTYSDYVTTHEEVSASVATTFSAVTANWPNDTAKDISVTNAGNTAVAGTLTLHYSTVNTFSESTTLGQANNTTERDLFYWYSSPTFSQADVGVLQTTTFSIDSSTQPYATFNCAKISGGNGIRYGYGATKDAVTGYYANSGSDVLGMEIVSCTDTTVTVTYTPTEAGKGFTLSLVGSAGGTSDAMLLTDQAVSEQWVGPYQVTTVRTPQGKNPITTRAQRLYDFSEGAGTGSQTPRATLQTYIDDANPTAPTGQTADGQDSDADNAPGVTLQPGSQTVSFVVKNTGFVAQSGGTIKDAQGNVVANVPALAAGESVVLTRTVTIGEGDSFSADYTVVMNGPVSSSAPASDPVNAQAVVITPEAAMQSYIADENPNAPTGETEDGQDSDADNSPGVAVLPGDQTVSFVVRNTGSVPLTGGEIQDEDGNVVATVPAIAVGESVVVKTTVPVGENVNFSENYTAVMQGAKKPAAPVSDPVNANGLQVTPSASYDKATTPYETPVTIDVLANDLPGNPRLPLDPSTLTLLDANGNPVTSLTDRGGTYTVSNGKIVFTPDARFYGRAKLVNYRISDVAGHSAQSTVVVVVDGVTPKATNDTATTQLNTTVSVDVLANDDGGAADVPMDPSTLTLLDANGNPVSSLRVNGGTYKVVNGKVTFTPDCNFTGTAPAAAYQVANIFGQTASANVQVTVSGYPPSARDDYAYTPWGWPTTVNVLANDKGGTNDPLVSSTLKLLDSNGNEVTSLKVRGGVYKVVNGRIAFTPDCWFLGAADPVRYQVATASGVKVTAKVQVSVGWC